MLGKFKINLTGKIFNPLIFYFYKKKGRGFGGFEAKHGKDRYLSSLIWLSVLLYRDEILLK